MRIALLVLSLWIGQSVLAQPAVYLGETLSIPQGAVVNEGQVAYYENIRLRLNAAGDFEPEAAESRALVGIESVSVNVLESLPLQVSLSISGNKSNPCVELLTPAVSYSEGIFTVVMAEGELGPNETCIAVIAPFETSLSLDMTGLEPGDYIVRVNDVETEFTLTM